MTTTTKSSPKTTKASATKAIAESKKTAVNQTVAPPQAEIIIEELRMETILIPIRGISPLIQHAFSEKARKMLLESMQNIKKVKKEREPKDPVAEFEDAKYLLPDGRAGHPVVAFKAATVDACSLFSNVTKVAMKRALFFEGEGPDMLVPLEYSECEMRQDTPRIGMGSIDLRYRPSYHDWKCVLEVKYLPHLISRDSVVSLVNAGGLGGVGEWRPSAPKSNSGVFGRYEVDPDRETMVKG
jgi:hypothetical protein